ncbi:lens fiber membrane intrinsic protein [Hydra vulgaris]|uniref:lens fiber membrane intrinsic protein n=1 Tax=Hydra vulgaris TaxID=6087 RepID=UPI000640BB94
MCRIALNVINCVLISVGLGFAILSTVGNFWVELSLSYYYEHAGLWNWCDIYICRVITNATDILTVTRVFMIIGCVSYFFAFVLNLLTCSKKIKQRKTSGVLLCATAIFLAIGMSVYTNEANKNGAYKYRWSYIFGWCSFSISIVSAYICFAIEPKNDDPIKPKNDVRIELSNLDFRYDYRP